MDGCARIGHERRSSVYKSSLNKSERTCRLASVIAGELLVFLTLIILITKKEYTHLAMCIGSFAMVWLPIIIELLFSCKMNTAMYILGEFYALSPLFGECYKLYYLTSWWDKLLHACGGIVFALFGFYLFRLLTGDKKRFVAAAIFALCFSVALSVLWEFVEYGCDTILDMDMQNDTVVHEIHSYFLSDEPGVRGHLSEIREVTVDGTALPADGYIDIGLHDTMQDMMVETFGALIVSLYVLLDRGRHSPFTHLKNDKTGVME